MRCGWLTGWWIQAIRGNLGGRGGGSFGVFTQVATVGGLKGRIGDRVLGEAVAV